MKKVAKFLIRLYPGAWRVRYGDEFHALLDDSPPKFSTLFDLLKGAIQMQLAVPNFPRVALLLSSLGLLVGLGISFLVTPRYTSSAELSAWNARPELAGNQVPAELFLRYREELQSRASLSSIIQDPRLDLYKRQRALMPLEDVIEVMRRDLHIDPVEHRGLSSKDWLAFRIAFTYSDPHKTQAVVQVMITKFQEQNLTDQHVRVRAQQVVATDEVTRLEARVAMLEQRLGMPSSFQGPPPVRRPLIAGVNLEVLDPPSLPELPRYPNRAFFSATGFATGLLVAILLTVFRRRVPPARTWDVA